MTNREAVIAEVQIGISSDFAIDKAMIDAGLNTTNAAQLYDGTYEEEVAKAALKVLKGMLSTKTVQEGGYSLTLQVEKRILDIQTDWGWLPVVAVVPPVEVPIPKIRGISVW